MTTSVSKYNSLHRDAVTGAIDLDDSGVGAFKVALLANTYSPNLTAHSKFSDVVAHELAAANGYTAGGMNLSNVTFTLSGAVGTFDADDVEWTATGGSLIARYAVVYYNTGAADNSQRELLMLIDFGADQSAGAGTPFRIVWPATGILRVQ